MAENLSLWQTVEKTPLEHVKPITGKSYSGNSPKPHYLIRKATETFGPCGIGWGFTVEERIEDGAWIAEGFYEKLHIAKVRVWFKWGGERGEVEHIGGTVFSGRRKNGQAFSDEDAPKKSVTDALVKALSMIGFAGDIFMGRYDDSKYVAELKQDAAEGRRQQQAPRQSDQHINEDATQDDEPSWSQMAAQSMADALLKRAGPAAVEAFLARDQVKDALSRLEMDDHTWVMRIAAERRAVEPVTSGVAA